MRFPLIFLLVFAFHALWAQDCQISLGPALPVVPRDASVLLESCGCPPNTLLGMGPAWLVSADRDSVPLRTVAHFNSRNEQLLLATGRLLRPGQQYRLVVPAFAGNPNIALPKRVAWESSDLIPENLIGFKTQPKVRARMKLEEGGKIYTTLVVAFTPLDSAWHWVTLELEDKWTGEVQRWVEPCKAGQQELPVGWPLRPCGPGFGFSPGAEYRLVLTLYGIDGAEGRSSDPLEFTAPE